MGMTLWKYYSVTGVQMHRCRGIDLDEALALSDKMKDNDALCAGFKKRSRIVGVRRLVTPRRAKTAVYEDGADQAHNPQCFR
jgi:hypothetical protein